MDVAFGGWSLDVRGENIGQVCILVRDQRHGLDEFVLSITVVGELHGLGGTHCELSRLLFRIKRSFQFCLLQRAGGQICQDQQMILHIRKKEDEGIGTHTVL